MASEASQPSVWDTQGPPGVCAPFEPWAKDMTWAFNGALCVPSSSTNSFATTAVGNVVSASGASGMTIGEARGDDGFERAGPYEPPTKQSSPRPSGDSTSELCESTVEGKGGSADSCDADEAIATTSNHADTNARTSGQREARASPPAGGVRPIDVVVDSASATQERNNGPANAGATPYPREDNGSRGPRVPMQCKDSAMKTVRSK